ncbi:MAG: MaoC family dehydratase [Acidimicrobiaceae bacterium]|nr:MaoC family dehydratase [Acidimicrobiaceae bacterium]MCY4175923.1 MaoC family dehydratase [Acidimicrobiaceae bacterium]MCY4280838.1 MaoC family dehydratase [Acidimicrobiaceae bacterium]MCY4293293.1 MaoC family dehydratase [Acidimicrobiaceae bacterium]
MSKAAAAYEVLKPSEGSERGHGDWFRITQEQINAFADCTEDHQFIHIDEERAKTETPFGGTIAHGFLTLSMIVHLMHSVPSETPPLDGLVMGINYGLDRVRFINPVSRGKRVRAHAAVKSVELKAGAVQVVTTVTVEIEDEPKPALVADWVTRMVFTS